MRNENGFTFTVFAKLNVGKITDFRGNTFFALNFGLVTQSREKRDVYPKHFREFRRTPVLYSRRKTGNSESSI